MTIQSPGDAASTAAWIDPNWPRLPCQVPTVHTLGLGPLRAGPAAALRPSPSTTAAVAAAATRSPDPEMMRQARAEDFVVRKAIHPLASPPPPNAATRWHYPPEIPRFQPIPAQACSPTQRLAEQENPAV